MSAARWPTQRRQIVARIAVWDRDQSSLLLGVRDYIVTRQRVRDIVYCQQHANNEPGKDGCRWRCSCRGIDIMKNKNPMRTNLCNHIHNLLNFRNVVEEELPECKRKDDALRSCERLVGIMHVQLTRLGEDLLRWRWAAAALKD